MMVGARKNPDTWAGACKRIGEQPGINSETLRGWVTQAEIDAGDRPGTTTTDAERLAGLERENRDLRRSQRDLEECLGFLRGGARPPLPLIIDYIEQHKHEHGVEPICATLTEADVKIAPSTYCPPRSRPPCARAVRNVAVTEAIKRVHRDNYGVYGIRKVHAALVREGRSRVLPGAVRILGGGRTPGRPAERRQRLTSAAQHPGPARVRCGVACGPLSRGSRPRVFNDLGKKQPAWRLEHSMGRETGVRLPVHVGITRPWFWLPYRPARISRAHDRRNSSPCRR
jgi:transposase-like protein